jgi:hypothetical protein
MATSGNSATWAAAGIAAKPRADDGPGDALRRAMAAWDDAKALTHGADPENSLAKTLGAVVGMAHGMGMAVDCPRCKKRVSATSMCPVDGGYHVNHM